MVNMVIPIADYIVNNYVSIKNLKTTLAKGFPALMIPNRAQSKRSFYSDRFIWTKIA